MAEEKVPDQKKLSNQISAETGQFDARFILWRMFSAENDIPVDTLPSELEGEDRDKWDRMKDERLHRPTETKPPDER